MTRAGAGLIKKAREYAAEGKHLQAIEALQRALRESSSLPEAMSLLGVEYLKLDDVPSAITHLKKAVVLVPWLAANHANLGYALCLMGDTAGGEKEIREAIKQDGNLPKAHFLLGVLLLDQPTDEARDHLLLAPNLSRAHLALAVYYARRGDANAAEGQLKAYLRKNHSVNSTSMERWVANAAALVKPASAFGFRSSPSDAGKLNDRDEVGISR